MYLSTTWKQLLDDDRHDVFFAHDQQLIAVNFDGLAGVLAEQDAVAHFDIQRTDFAVVENLAIAYGKDFALIRFSAAASGMMRPDAVLVSWSRRLTMTRSFNGRRFIQNSLKFNG